MAFGPAALFMVQGCPPGSEAEVSAWHAGEHIHERLSIPGFRRGRRGICPEAAPDARFLVIYEADAPEVFASPAYLERLNDPTPWSSRTFANHFAGLRRTVCRVVAGRGVGVGGWLGVALLDRPPGDLSGEIETALGSRGVIGAHVLKGTDIGQQKTAEQETRGGDSRFAGAVLLEGTDEDPLRAATGDLGRRLAPSLVAVYRLQHMLTAAEAAEIRP